jgi:tRNA(fMet)-specific endonuclease VapC
MDKICLDTDFLVDFLRGKEHAINFIEDVEGSVVLATTYVNLFELYRGAYSSGRKEKELESLQKLKSRLDILNFSDKSAERAGMIEANLRKHGNIIDFRDLFIGTIALAEGFSVKTNNRKHFTKIEGLSIL